MEKGFHPLIFKHNRQNHNTNSILNYGRSLSNMLGSDKSLLHIEKFHEKGIQPRLVWLSGLSASLRTKRLPILF